MREIEQFSESVLPNDYARDSLLSRQKEVQGEETPRTDMGENKSDTFMSMIYPVETREKTLRKRPDT